MNSSLSNGCKTNKSLVRDVVVVAVVLFLLLLFEVVVRMGIPRDSSQIRTVGSSTRPTLKILFKEQHCSCDIVHAWPRFLQD